jgi:hypothetical protein
MTNFNFFMYEHTIKNNLDYIDVSKAHPYMLDYRRFFIIIFEVIQLFSVSRSESNVYVYLS